MHTISSRAARALLLLALIAIRLEAQSPNDECTGALALGNGSNGPYYTLSATSSAPVWPRGAGGSDLWFFYVPTCHGIATIDTCGSSFDMVLDGACGCGLSSLACNDDSCGRASSVTLPLVANQAYFLRVGGFAGRRGASTS